MRSSTGRRRRPDPGRPTTPPKRGRARESRPSHACRLPQGRRGGSSRPFRLALHTGCTFRGRTAPEAVRSVAPIQHTYAEKRRADERTRTADLLITSGIRVPVARVHRVRWVLQVPINRRILHASSSSGCHRSALRPARLQYGCSKPGTGKAFGQTGHDDRTSGRRSANPSTAPRCCGVASYASGRRREPPTHRSARDYAGWCIRTSGNAPSTRLDE